MGLENRGGVTGIWGYKSGVNGTPVIPTNGQILQITAIALGAVGSFTINGGDTITIPYNSSDKASSSITIIPCGNLIAPVVVFDSGVDAYFIEFVT